MNAENIIRLHERLDRIEKRLFRIELVGAFLLGVLGAGQVVGFLI